MATDPAGEIGPRRVQGPPTVAAGAVRPARGPASVLRPAAPRPPPILEVAMEAIIERAAGLDVHQGSVVACVILGTPGRRPSQETRTFGTMSRDLVALRAWLLELGVTHVGMEATGVYWRPVHAALEGAFTVIVGNASHHAQRARPQDRREGRGVDRRPGPARPGARQLRAAPGGQGAARPRPPPQGAGGRAWRPSATARSSCSRAPASSSPA